MQNSLSEVFGDIAGAIRTKTGDENRMKLNDFSKRFEEIKLCIDEYYGILVEGLINRDPKVISGSDKILDFRDFKFVDGTNLSTFKPYSFAGFNTVKGMCFDNISILQSDNIFYGCSQLQYLDLSLGWNVGLGIWGKALNSLNSLSAIIVRNDVPFTTLSINSDNGSTSRFYIYVPRHSYDAVIANLKSSTSTTIIKDTSRIKILEDYPSINNWQQYV